MKKTLLLFLALFSTNIAFAEDWKTNDGVVYRDVKVVRVEADAITIMDKDGGALVFLVNLPAPLQKRFSYDPVKAKIAAQARVKEDAENARQLQAEIELADKMRRDQQIKDAQAKSASSAAVGQ